MCNTHHPFLGAAIVVPITFFSVVSDTSVPSNCFQITWPVCDMNLRLLQQYIKRPMRTTPPHLYVIKTNYCDTFPLERYSGVSRDVLWPLNTNWKDSRAVNSRPLAEHNEFALL